MYPQYAYPQYAYPQQSYPMASPQFAPQSIFGNLGNQTPPFMNDWTTAPTINFSQLLSQLPGMMPGSTTLTQPTLGTLGAGPQLTPQNWLSDAFNTVASAVGPAVSAATQVAQLAQQLGILGAGPQLGQQTRMLGAGPQLAPQSIFSDIGNALSTVVNTVGPALGTAAQLAQQLGILGAGPQLGQQTRMLGAGPQLMPQSIFSDIGNALSTVVNTVGPALGTAAQLAQQLGVFGAGPQLGQQTRMMGAGPQLSPQGIFSDIGSALNTVMNVVGPAVNAAGQVAQIAQQLGILGAGPQQARMLAAGPQLTPQSWISSVLSGAAPFISAIPGVGPVLGPAAGMIGATGLLGARPQFFPAPGNATLN